MILKPPMAKQYNNIRDLILDDALDVGIAAAKLKVTKDTGELAKSIEKKNSGNGFRTYGTNLDYALAQEFGLPNKKKYRFNPYLRPSAVAIIAKIGLILSRYL
jgi:hypothetical protein